MRRTAPATGRTRQDLARAAPSWFALALTSTLSVSLFSAVGQTDSTRQQASATVSRSGSSAGAPVEEGLRWNQLSADQRNHLAPLERSWPALSATRKMRWIEVSQRLPSMPEAERARVRQRMEEWAALSPAERVRARIQFQEAKQIDSSQRRAQWEAYQALPPERRQELAATRVPPVPPANSGGQAAAAGVRSEMPSSRHGLNITPNPAFAKPPRPVSASTVQARPGATTRPLNQPATPPAHQQVGLPKITAASNFIDKNTLLPRRGPQAAAILGVATSADPLERP